MSTHILEEVEAICTRAIIIGSGKIVADGTPESLKKQSKLHGAVTIELIGTDIKDALVDLPKVRDVDRVEQLPATETSVVVDEDKNSKRAVTIRVYPVPGRSIAQAVASFIHQKNWQVDGFNVEKGDLSEVFANLTKGGIGK